MWQTGWTHGANLQTLPTTYSTWLLCDIYFCNINLKIFSPFSKTFPFWLKILTSRLPWGIKFYQPLSFQQLFWVLDMMMGTSLCCPSVQGAPQSNRSSTVMGIMRLLEDIMSGARPPHSPVFTYSWFLTLYHVVRTDAWNNFALLNKFMKTCFVA